MMAPLHNNDNEDFRPALIVVDFQNDFCPPVRALVTELLLRAKVLTVDVRMAHWPCKEVGTSHLQ